MKSDKQKMVKASFEALASLEKAMEITKKVGISNSDRIVKNMTEICHLVEEMMEANEEEMEKHYKEWESKFEDKTDMMIGQTIMAMEELKRKK